MHVGLFFGSFNPVHIGHMVLANFMLEFTVMDEVWFVVSPQNPLKEKASLLDQHQRLALVNLAIDDMKGMRASNIEFSLPRPSYTINTLVQLRAKFPSHTFSLIMGSDNLATFHRWKNHEEILENHQVYVYPRVGSAESRFWEHPSVNITNAPLIELSSTFIREGIRMGKEMRYFLPQPVWKEIDEMNFYR